MDALFHRHGDDLVPTDFARGPWSPDALHGGPVAAALARAAEGCEADPVMHVARLTVEILRPVPVAPLHVSARLSRPGHKVQVVEVVLSHGDTELAWGRAVRIRRHGADDPKAEGLLSPPAGPAPGEPGAPPGPEEGKGSPPLVEGYRAFHNAGAELRFVAGEFNRQGPATVWVRLQVPVVDDEEPTPLQRAAAAADFGNGISSVLDYERYVFINPDLTVSLARAPRGEWVCLEAATQLGEYGVGTAESRLWDEHGPVGRAVQSLVVERRRHG
ncbi:MAG: thioesterase family protein [Acidimicrobiales bacterium]